MGKKWPVFLHYGVNGTTLKHQTTLIIIEEHAKSCFLILYRILNCFSCKTQETVS